jgi:hypothetical protein
MEIIIGLFLKLQRAVDFTSLLFAMEEFYFDDELICWLQGSPRCKKVSFLNECNEIVCFKRAISSNALFDGEWQNIDMVIADAS